MVDTIVALIVLINSLCLFGMFLVLSLLPYSWRNKQAVHTPTLLGRGTGVALTCVVVTVAGPLPLFGGITTNAVSQPIRTTGRRTG